VPGDLISVDEARARVLATVRALPAEPVRVDDAQSRVLAEDIVAELDLPPFASSAMDGFAVVSGAGGQLAIVGEAKAGAPYEGRIEAGQAVRISTGAVIPDGADAIVPIERVLDGAGTDRVGVPDTSAGAHLRAAGEDVRRGDTVMRRGTTLGPAEVAMLAALGRVDAPCARRPVVAIAATGDELRSAGDELQPGQIYDSNAVAIAALAARAGAVVGSRRRIRDDAAATRDDIARASEGADALCITGGVSVGPHDHVKGALADLGFDEVIWRVSLKPGKPFWFGARGDQYAFGLPGNPVSAMVTFQLFVGPALRALQGADPSASRSTAILDGPIRANADRDQAVRCRLRMADDGWHAEPTGPQGSHVISSMLGADALAIVAAGERDLAPGERVPIEVL
jgi:molybdopterin molybdotransferase